LRRFEANLGRGAAGQKEEKEEVRADRGGSAQQTQAVLEPEPDFREAREKEKKEGGRGGRVIIKMILIIIIFKSMVYTRLLFSNIKEYTPSFIKTIPYS